MTEGDGRRLAARWQIERLRRPAGPDLVWLGFAKPEIATFPCLACGDAAFKQAVLRARGHTLYICSGCASHQFHPPPPVIPPDRFAVRHALEYASDVDAAAATAARAMAGPPGLLLDLGCRLGLVVDIAASQPGWTAAGVDPGPLAALGAAALGASLRHGGVAAAAAIGGAAADVVLCEGVLERTADPLAMLRALPALSRPRARWLIALADAAGLYEAETADALAHIAAPDRLLLVSEPGLRALLRRSLIVELATAAIAPAPEGLRVTRPGQDELPASDALLNSYLAARLAKPCQEASLDARLRVAALRRAVERQDWDAARAHLGPLQPALAAATEAAEARADRASLPDLFRAAPLFSGTLLFLAALVQHRDPQTRDAARRLCALAAGLRQRAFALSPALMDGEAEGAAIARDAAERMAA